MADAPNELQGWKEIAAHLGRSTRAAQRWEVLYGLPVRRVGGTVFADRAELDAWKRSPRGQSAAGALRGPDDDEAVAPPGPVPAAVPEPGPKSPRWFTTPRVWLTAATLTGAATVAAVLLLTLGHSTAGWLKRGAAPALATGWDRAGLDQGPWPGAHHDSRQSARGHTRGPADPATPRLLFDPGGALSPEEHLVATSRDLIIGGTCDGRVFAVRLDGSLAWQTTLDREHNPETVYGLAVNLPGEFLLVATGACGWEAHHNPRTQFHVRRIDTGQSLFRLRTGAMMIPPAVSAQSVAYQADQYNTVRAVDSLGDLKWTVDLPGFAVSVPAVGVDGTIYVGTDGSNYGQPSLWAISQAGRPLWGALEGYLLRLALGDDGHLYAVDANRELGGQALGPQQLVSVTTDGTLRWRADLPGQRAQVARDSLAIGPSGPVVRTPIGLTAFDGQGSQRWHVALSRAASPSAGAILDRDETTYLSAGDEVIAVDRDGRERWRAPVPQAGRIILAGEGVLAVASANRRIFLVQDRDADPARTETAGPR